jgi:hypothetical protein
MGNNLNFDAKFVIVTGVKIQVAVFWFVKYCSDVVGYQRLGGP